ncbi:CPBP family intramembrane glutamic endopeptidase [Halovenus halobia]|uniref:CPBP family intramembrane glutamic endopeptidase n=1 Tax=Halovenus halobia TaxID=3396622 RepID=UPI003F5687D4
MKENLRRGLSAVFWNTDQRRFRAPFRFAISSIIVLVFVLLLGLVAFLIGSAVGDLGPIPTAVAEIASLFALVGAVLAVSWIVDRRQFRDIGLDLDTAWRRAFGVGLAIGAAMVVAVVAVVLLTTGRLDGTLLTRNGTLFAGLSVPVGLLVAAAYFLAIGTLEELIFRGYVLVNVAEGSQIVLEGRTATLLAAAVSAGLFGLVHASNPNASVASTLIITLFGLFLAGAYVLTDSLALPIGIHTGWNFVLGPVFGLPVSGLTTSVALIGVDAGGSAVTGGQFGPEGGIVALVGLLVGAGLLAGWLNWNGEFSVSEQVAKPDLWRRS